MLKTLWKSTVFCEESYNASPHDLALLVIVVFNQKKIDKDNIENIIKKNYIGKHCSNPLCFKEKKYKAKF